MIDWIKEILQKTLTVGIVAIAAEFESGATIEYKLLAMAFVYAVWTKVIAPRIEDFFKQEATGTKMEAIHEKSGFDLI